jgi:hypothetical protein
MILDPSIKNLLLLSSTNFSHLVIHTGSFILFYSFFSSFFNFSVIEFLVFSFCSVNEGYLRYTQFRAVQHVTSAAMSVLSTQVCVLYITCYVNSFYLCLHALLSNKDSRFKLWFQRPIFWIINWFLRYECKLHTLPIKIVIFM